MSTAMKTILVFLLAFIGSLTVTMLIMQTYGEQQQAQASNAIASSGNVTNNATIPFPSLGNANESLIAQNISRVNVTILGTNAILNLDPVTFTGSLQVIGEVFNNGTEDINASNFIIPAVLYDVNNTIVGTFSGMPEMSLIEANNSSPFKVTFFDSDVSNGVLSAFLYKVQADNKSVFGLVPPPPPLALGVTGGVPLGPVPGGVPFSGGGFPGGPLMGTGPILPGSSPIPIPPGGNRTCDPNYDKCVPVYPPDVDCTDVGMPKDIKVIGNDVHRLDRAGVGIPGIGCESGLPLLPTNQTGINQTLANQTQPTNQTQGPDESCLFDTSQPKCAADADGNCPDGYNVNEDGNCFPQHSRCPDGYHSEEDNETGECYPDSKPCPPGYAIDPDFPTCAKQPEQIALSSTANMTNSTGSGEEQKEEEEGQGAETTDTTTAAGPASVTSDQTGQQEIKIEPEPATQDEEGQENNEENNAEEEEN